VLKSTIRVGRNLIKSFMQRGYAVDVCFTCHRYAPLVGGYETQLKLLAEKLSKFFNVKIVTFKLVRSSSFDVLDRIEVYRLKPQMVFFRVPFSFNYLRTLREVKFDILHAHGSVPIVSDASIFVAKSKRKPAVYTHHFDGNVQDSRSLNKLADFYNRTVGSFSARFADAIVATSRSYAETSPTLRYFLSKVQVIPCAVDSKRFFPQPKFKADALKKQLGLIGKKVVLFVGRIVPYKGLEYLIRAIQHITNEMEEPDFNLLLVGESEGKHITNPSNYFKTIQDLVRISSLESNVQFLGRVGSSELPIYYSLADVVVLPSVSRGEAFGTALIESLACGTPVVASDLPGVRDVLHGERSIGCYVPPKEEYSLARNIVKMAYSKDEVSESCRQFAIEKYSIEENAKKYKQIYESLT